jgi:homeobox protein cut-like
MQVMHGELEASLRSAEERLAAADTELAKQKALNERLENDLLQMDQHKSHSQLEAPKQDEYDPLSSSTDLLADLDLGKRPTVRHFHPSPLITF